MLSAGILQPVLEDALGRRASKNTLQTRISDTTKFSPYQILIRSGLTFFLWTSRSRRLGMDYLQEEDYYPPPPPGPTNGVYQPAPADPYDGMPPPPEGSYPTLPDLMSACQNHARAHGYACVTSSNNYKRGIAYVRCDRGGEYVNHWKLTPETRIRKNRTRRLVGCNWKARAKRSNTGEWVLTMMNPKHNGHGPSESATQHPSLRQLPPEAMEEAKDMFKDSRSPKEVLEVLQRRWNPDITAQDIYNLKAKIARLESRAALQFNEIPETPQGSRLEDLDTPTDPRLMAQPLPMPQQPTAPMQEGEVPRMAGKCQCTCCDH